MSPEEFLKQCKIYAAEYYTEQLNGNLEISASDCVRYILEKMKIPIKYTNKNKLLAEITVDLDKY